MNRTIAPTSKFGNIFVPIIILWGIGAIALFALVWLEGGFSGSLKEYYLLPWVVMTGIIVLAPTAYLYYQGKFDPFHPLVFAAWSYIFPAFIVGGGIVAFKLVDPYFLVFIEDPEYNLPLSLFYIAIGFVGLTIGFSVPIGRYIAEKIEPRVPNWQWKSSEIWAGGILLLIVGLGVNIAGFLQGLLGYQRISDIGTYDAFLYFLLVIVSLGNMLLWLGIFRAKERTGAFYLVLAILIAFIPLRAALLGNRSSFLVSVFPIIMAFRYSGRVLSWRTSAIFGGLLTAAVFIGIIYGTSFRNIKGSEGRIEAGDYAGQVFATVEYLVSEDPILLIQNSGQALADRIENLSSVAVVVSNYERLAPFEASYGLENNIINDTLTSFVPRFLWQDKPATSDARAYSLLYFNYGENSFAISPFADLLRNFGPIGVPLGMFVLGIYLRTIYRLFVDTPSPSMWKYTAYLPLLILVSYESFYATILPSVVRTVAVLAVSLFIVNLVTKIRVKAK